MHFPTLPLITLTLLLLLPSLLVSAVDPENLQHGDRIPGANPDDPEELVIDVSKMSGFPGFQILEEPGDGGGGVEKGKGGEKGKGAKPGAEKGKGKKKKKKAVDGSEVRLERFFLFLFFFWRIYPML